MGLNDLNKLIRKLNNKLNPKIEQFETRTICGNYIIKCISSTFSGCDIKIIYEQVKGKIN